ncbi:MAG: S8 family serine peptidase [candidate division Zixibacteria bacterium]|nr:S8 family serine peptidase [candidate division Zixibacteria bacterium]
MRKLSLTLTTLLVAFAWLMAQPVIAEKIKIERLDDLPRYTYKLDIKAVELLDDDEALLKLAHELKTDLKNDLEKYEILDKTTLKGYYGVLGVIAMLDHRYDDYHKYLKMSKQLEEKEAKRLTAGLFTNSYIAAVSGDNKDILAAIKKEYSNRVNGLPYEVVGDELESSKGRAEMISRNLIVGIVGSRIQPILDKTNGEISKDVAEQLVSMGYTIHNYLPYNSIVVEVLDAYIDANKVEKTNIWADREVTLEQEKDYTPVTICIWDSGSDIALFNDQLWTNNKEIPNNDIDDDNNGYVDDVHGMAYTYHSDKTKELLYPIENVEKNRPRLERLMKGLSDIQANVDSDESTELKKIMSSMKPEEVKPFIEDVAKYGNHAHGTHVAGIALRGNPYARLLTSRITFDYHMIPEKPTLKQARKDSVATVETIKYYKDNGVRVVNMSWGGSLSGVESALEANNVGETPEERKAFARKLFEIGKSALYESIKNAPEILFITSAGNADNNVNFEEYIPSGFDLPNIISIGAVDQAGDETSFTSFGKVDVYANGFEVKSYIPGGHEMKLSGTSMSSPNTTNLAAKLLAVRPDLTTAQLRNLLIDAADVKVAGDREVRLLNPVKSLELLAQMK